MNCESAQDHLERMCLGGDCGDAAEELAAHLGSCASCRAVEEELRVTIASEQARLDKGSHEAFNLARDAATAESQRVRQMQKRLRVVGGVLKTAAVLAVVWGLSAFFLNRQPEQQFQPSQPAQITLKVKWTTSEIGETVSANRPLVAGSKVFVLRNYSKVRFVAALNRSTGEEEWISDFPVVTPPLMGDGSLLSWRRLDGRLRLTAIDLSTGKELWGYEPKIGRSLWRKQPEAMVNSHVVCWTIGRRIWALDARSGEVCWQKKLTTGKGRLSAPRIVEDRLAVADGRRLYLIDAKRGVTSQKITYSMTARAVPNPMVEGNVDRMYISQHAAGKQGKLYCCDLAAGKLLWSQSTKRPTSFQVVRDRAYVRSNVIQAFDCDTGHLMWTNDIDGCSPVSVEQNRVYVMRSKNKREIVALNSATGERDSVIVLPDDSCAGMTIADGSSYIATRHGRIYALSLPH